MIKCFLGYLITVIYKTRILQKYHPRYIKYCKSLNQVLTKDSKVTVCKCNF